MTTEERLKAVSELEIRDLIEASSAAIETMAAAENDLAAVKRQLAGLSEWLEIRRAEHYAVALGNVALKNADARENAARLFVAEDEEYAARNLERMDAEQRVDTLRAMIDYSRRMNRLFTLLLHHDMETEHSRGD